MVMGRNNQEPLYNMSRDMRKQTLCICEKEDTKRISVFVFAKCQDSTIPLLSKSEISVV